MKYIHISDIELQNYLDGNYIEEKKQVNIENHLNSCEKCLSNLKIYKNLYLELNTTPELFIPENFSEEVMEKILRGELIKRRFLKFLNIFSLIISGIFSIFIFIYYSSFSPIKSVINEQYVNLFNIFNESCKQLVSYLPFKNTNPVFILYLFLIIIMLYIVDKLLIKYTE